MTTEVFLNGRFLSQIGSGVQRFSAEIAHAVDRLAAAGEWPCTTVLTPRPGPGAAGPPFARLLLRQVGRLHGHAWEQAELPGAARGGVLLNLGNTAPVLAGRRQVVVIHDAGVFDVPESYSPQFRAWYKALQRGLVWTGARVATVSNFSRARIAARLGLDPAEVAVTYEGADHILRVAPAPGTPGRYGLKPGRFAVFVGNRAAHKNLQSLQATAEALHRRGMAVAVIGGGNPGVFSHLPATAGCRVLGRVSDAELRALYDGAACLLFPSRYEGFGLPPVEAMACNCPVIAARGGAVEEVCGDGALFFDPAAPGSLLAAFDQLLDDPPFAAALRGRGRARAAQLTWDAAARVLGSVVQQVH